MRLTLRFQIELGPRTIVMNGLSEKDAHAICGSNEFTGSVDLDAPRVSLVAHMRKHKAAMKRKPKVLENVLQLKRRMT